MPSANFPSNTPSSSLTILATNIRRDSAGRYCLNDCHKASGGEKKNGPSYWLTTVAAQKLIDALKGDTGNPVGPTNVVNDGLNNGTYAVKELVYAYAMWISAEFSLTVIRAFDAMVTGVASPKPKRERKPAFDAAYRRFMNVAALLPNLDDNQRALMAARGTFNLTGINPLEVMGHVSLPAPNNETHCTPTQIGEKIGTTGRVVNVLLIERGYQRKDDGSASGSSYVPTEKGKPFARFFDTTRRNGSGSQQQLKWSEGIIPHLSPR